MIQNKPRQLLDDAGWVDSNGDGTRDKDGVELDRLRYITNQRELRKNVQAVVQQQWTAGGHRRRTGELLQRYLLEPL